MLLHGRTSNSFLTGSSVHNQRIERLWRDTYRCVLSVFYQVFYYLEDKDKLHPDSDVDLYCLHYVYVKKINLALQLFTDGWNSHAMTTEHGMTPAQMFTTGTLLSGCHSLMTNYSFNDTTCISSRDLGPTSVAVPSTNCPLTAQQTVELESLARAHDHYSEDDYCIELYDAIRNFVYQHM